MKTISTILLIAAGAAVLAAVWAPGAWWQWAITALVLFLAGAGTGGAATNPRRHYEGGEVGPARAGNASGPHVRITPNRPGEVLNSTGDPELDEKLNARPTYGKTREENDR